VSSEGSEEAPLQVNRGKERPETAGKPLPFTAMLGLKTLETRFDCDPGLEAEMRLLGCLDENEEQQPWEDLPTNADEQEAPFSLGVGAQCAKPEDKLQALLQEKVEKEKEKEKESLPKGEGLGREIQWHEGLAHWEPTLAEVTAGGNVVNPQAQPFGAGDEEKGGEVASPSMRLRTTDQDMVDALLESPRKRKEEAPAPLVQDGGRKEAKKSKKSGDSKKERKKARRAEQAKRAEAALKETERRLEQESSPAVVSAHAPKELAGPEEGRAMKIDRLEKERASGQRDGQKPAETQLNPQPKPIQQKPPPAFDQNSSTEPDSKKPAVVPDKSPAPQLATVPEKTARDQHPDSPKGKAQALLNNPPPTKPESVPANPLTNLALAQTAPAKASDQSTQTDFDKSKSTEESWEVTFLANGYVRVKITMRESNGRLRPPAEHMMPEEEFFEKPWADVMLDVLVRSHVRAAMAESWMPSQICLQFEGAALQKRSVLNCGNCVAGWEFE
jgi:hypothetical protein